MSDVRLILNYLVNRGFSIGFKDAIISDKLMEANKELINSKILLTKHLITQFENEKDAISPEIIEDSIKSELNTVMPNLGKILMDSLDDSNAFNVLISSKAKGKTPKNT